MIPGAAGDAGDYAIAQVTGHVPRNHMEAAPVFDEITGDPLNDPVGWTAATHAHHSAARHSASHRAHTRARTLTHARTAQHSGDTTG
jgi:hypothetical protein